MFIDSRQNFRAAEPVAACPAPGMSRRAPIAAQGIHRLGQGIVASAQLPRTAPQTTGMSAAAMVETASGWCRAADLRRGMLIHTMDGGLRPLADVAIVTIWPGGEGSGDLLHVPGGILGACDDLWLMPDQCILVGSPLVQQALGLPHVQLAARHLAGFGACRLKRSDAAQQIVTLRFSQPEAIWVNSGLVLCCDGTLERAGEIAPRLDADHAADLVGLLSRDRLARAWDDAE